MVVLRLQVVHQQLSAIFQHMYLDKKRNGENAHGNVGMQPMGMGTMQPAGMPLQQQGGYPGSINENQAAEIVYAGMKEQPDPDNQGFKQDFIVAGVLPLHLAVALLEAPCQILTRDCLCSALWTARA